MINAYRMPPRLTGPDGAPRCVGVELEFANLDAPAAAGLVRDLYGGWLESEDPHRCAVRGTRLGDFTVELDMRAAHPARPDKAANTLPEKVEQFRDRLRPLWGNIGSLIMPFEIAAPPVPFDQLAELDALIAGLRARGAAGTQASPLFAFGLHLNPSIADDGVDYLLDNLKAFLILAPWLRREIRIDPTRRLSGFVTAFPTDYAAKVVDPSYRPVRAGVIADYLAANPSRNRELDLFPLFAHLDRAAMADKLGDPHVQPRPTFHYRLPNARLGDPDWSLAADWNRWVAVEEVAADRARLDRLGRRYRDLAARQALDGWAAEIDRELAQLRDAG